MSEQTTTPLAELETGERYEATIYVDVDVTRYPPQRPWTEEDMRTISQSYVVEVGRNGDSWSLRTRSWNAETEEAGVALLDVRGSGEQPHPLALLRALLSGGSA